MIPGKVSILIPSRHERFLHRTILDLLEKCQGDIEILPVLDGYWPDPMLPADPRVCPIHLGQQTGMRGGINAAARLAQGEFLLKIDGHCMVGEGIDQILKADCDGDWVVIPRRYSLDPENWVIFDNGKAPVDAHYLSYPFARPGDKTNGLHGTVWTERAKARKDILIDDEMSSQGSCWFMRKSHWDRQGELNVSQYGTFAQEFQEVGMKTWLSGGSVKVNKQTWYAHLHKGKTYGTGYQFNNAQWAAWAEANAKSRAFTIDHWMYNRWPQRTRDLSWLIDHFSPVPTWPVDWQAQVYDQRQRA